MAEGGNSKQFVYESEIRGFSVFMGPEKDTNHCNLCLKLFKRRMPILLSLYFWRSTTSAAKKRALTLVQTCTLIGILTMIQKNSLVCAYWSMCGKYGEYGTLLKRKRIFKAILGCIKTNNSKGFKGKQSNFTTDIDLFLSFHGCINFKL